jgi:hypothetical protein
MQDCNQYILHKTTHLQHKGTNLWKHPTLYNSNCIIVWERCYINNFSLHLVDQSFHIPFCVATTFNPRSPSWGHIATTMNSPTQFWPFFSSKKCQRPHIHVPFCHRCIHGSYPKNATFCPSLSSKLYLPCMTSTLLSLSTIGAFIEVLETLLTLPYPDYKPISQCGIHCTFLAIHSCFHKKTHDIHQIIMVKGNDLSIFTPFP